MPKADCCRNLLQFKRLAGKHILCSCSEIGIDNGGDRFSWQLCGMLTQMGEKVQRLYLVAPI